MRTVILGKNIKKTYSVDTKQKNSQNDKSKVYYTGMPKMKIKEEVTGHEEICSFEGEMHYNVNKSYFELVSDCEFNISENETVTISDEIFRADLNEMHIFTNKVMSCEEVDKEKAEKSLKYHTRMFNRQMIESNNKMKLHCDVNSLSYEKTDCIKLFELVYGHSNWKIENGSMVACTSYDEIDCCKYDLDHIAEQYTSIAQNAWMK